VAGTCLPALGSGYLAGFDPGGSDRSLSVASNLAEPDTECNPNPPTKSNFNAITDPNAINDPDAVADRHRHPKSAPAPEPVALAELKSALANTRSPAPR